MDPKNQNNNMPMLADAQRPPHFNTRNIGSGYVQRIGNDSNDADSAAYHAHHVQTLLQKLVHEHSLTPQIEISDDGVSCRSSSASSDGDEGLEDHQREQHLSDADVGHSRVGEMKRQLAHHHFCECPLCPYRRNASVAEWLFNSPALDIETPGSMYPEQGSGELSMVSSMFLDTGPQTPAQLLLELGAWDSDGGVGGATQYLEEHCNYISSPLWLLPERILPRQLEACIPEESEPESEHGY